MDGELRNMNLLELQYTECYCMVDTGPRGMQKLSLQNYSQSPLPIHTRAVETGAQRRVSCPRAYSY